MVRIMLDPNNIDLQSLTSKTDAENLNIVNQSRYPENVHYLYLRTEQTSIDTTSCTMSNLQ